MPRRVDKAILWTNGMLMCFDRDGQQVPEYQGLGVDMIPKLRKDFPDLVIVAGDWTTDVTNVYY